MMIPREEKQFIGVITIKSAHLIDALDKEDYIKKVKETWNDLHDIELTDEEITGVREK